MVCCLCHPFFMLLLLLVTAAAVTQNSMDSDFQDLVVTYSMIVRVRRIGMKSLLI